MINLSDTQAILLSNAGQRDDASLLPLPASLKPGGGVTKAMGVLIRHGLAEERETSDPAAVRRTEGDVSFGLYLTTAGAAAIGVAMPSDGAADANTDAGKGWAGEDGAGEAAPPAKRSSKTNAILDLLGRPNGATLADLITATGWLPHTTRAALTGLRKKGHEVARGKRDGITFYAIAAK